MSAHSYFRRICPDSTANGPARARCGGAWDPRLQYDVVACATPAPAPGVPPNGGDRGDPRSLTRPTASHTPVINPPFPTRQRRVVILPCARLPRSKLLRATASMRDRSNASVQFPQLLRPLAGQGLLLRTGHLAAST